MGCRYVVARPSAISSPPTYTEARIHLEAPLMIHLLRWNESSKQQQGKERLWSTIYNNGLRYALTNTHDGLTGTAAVIEHVCGVLSRRRRLAGGKEAKSKYRVLLAVVAGKDE